MFLVYTYQLFIYKNVYENMKITENQLRTIIRENIQSVLNAETPIWTIQAVANNYKLLLAALAPKETI